MVADERDEEVDGPRAPLGAMRELRDHLLELAPHELAAELLHMARDERAIAFRLLPKDTAIAVFEQLEPALQEELLEGLRENRVREIVEAMDPDDRARLVDEVPAAVARRLLAGLSPQERWLTSTLLGYPERSAGRIMTPEVVRLRERMTVGEALEHVRRRGAQAETIHLLPVTDEERRLHGAADLADLVLAAPDDSLADHVREIPSVRAGERQEAAARLMQEADLIAMPVTDEEGRLVGLVTVDDAMEVIEEEESEDIARAGGSEPLRQPYLSVSVLSIVRARVVWLFVLILAASLTVTVLDAFEDTLEAVVTLALFVPLLIGTGGNAGAQAATTMTRALALGDVRFADLGKVLLREVRIGFVMGSLFAVVAYLPVALIFGSDIATVVGLTLIVICSLATFMGSLLPLIADRVGVDPAVVSAPFIATAVDASGLVIYFMIAQAVLEI